MSIAIRRAELSDLPSLKMLIRALADFEVLPPPDEDAQLRFEQDGWPVDGSNPKFCAWLIEQNKRNSIPCVIGYAITFQTYSSFLAKPTLFLEDLFILPEYRKLGAGRAVFDHLLNEASLIGAGRIDWVVLNWNTGAQEFYQKLGAKYLSEWHCYRLEI